MKKMLEDLIAGAWAEKTSIGLALVAVICFIGRMISPTFFNSILENLFALFMAVMLVEIYLLRIRNSKDIGEIKRKLEDSPDILLFSTTKEFNVYLADRLKTAREIKVVHLSSYPSASWRRSREGTGLFSSVPLVDRRRGGGRG